MSTAASVIMHLDSLNQGLNATLCRVRIHETLCGYSEKAVRNWNTWFKGSFTGTSWKQRNHKRVRWVSSESFGHMIHFQVINHILLQTPLPCVVASGPLMTSPSWFCSVSSGLCRRQNQCDTALALYARLTGGSSLGRALKPDGPLAVPRPSDTPLKSCWALDS